jgi:hypothetical protein
MRNTKKKITSLLLSVNLLILLSGFCLMLFSPSQTSAASSVVEQEESSMENCGVMPVLAAENLFRINSAVPETPECCLAQNHTIASIITIPEPVRSSEYYGGIGVGIFLAQKHGLNLSYFHRPFPPPKDNSLSNIILRI